MKPNLNFKMTLLVLLLAVISTPALADWVKVGSGETVDQYVDPATIRKKGDRAKMWVLWDYKAPQVFPQNPHLKPWGTFRSDKRLWEYDCAEEETRILSAVYYSGRMGTGSVVYSTDSDPGKWQPITPDSIGETAWQIACGKIK